MLFKIFIKKSKDTTHRGAAVAFDSVHIHNSFCIHPLRSIFGALILHICNL